MENKVKLNPYQKILDKVSEKNIPFFMHFELTTKCNLKCIHCYNIPKSKKKDLPTVKVKSILDELAWAGTLFIGFTGGEILCRKDFCEIAQYARKKGFALRLFTNATQITAGIADKISDIQPLTVEISLYATNSKIHDRITTVFGSYNKTMQAIEMLKKRKINLVIKSIIMKENVQEYERLKAFTATTGARFIYDYVIIPCIDGSKRPLGHCLSDFQIKDLICRNVNKDVLKETNLKKPMELPENDQPICGAARSGACISSYGDVFPCITWRINLGSLKEKTFREIWHSSRINEIRNLTISKMKYCATCRLFSYCDHCPGMALLETGDALGKSPLTCRVARIRKEIMSLTYHDYNLKWRQKWPRKRKLIPNPALSIGKS